MTSKKPQKQWSEMTKREKLIGTFGLAVIFLSVIAVWVVLSGTSNPKSSTKNQPSTTNTQQVLPVSDGRSTNNSLLSTDNSTPDQTPQSANDSTSASDESLSHDTTDTTPSTSPDPVSTKSQPSTTQNTSSGCYPLTNGGNCYEPGEYCRASDHGASGVAGNGEDISCSYNNGWRWEPN